MSDDEIDTSTTTTTTSISSSSSSSTEWTVGLIFASLCLFLAAGLAEVGGGWLVWQTMRENKAWWMALLGSLILILYGFIPTWQPIDNFGRIYAVYGGFFIVLSYLWGWAVDCVQPDLGDWVGGGIALVGVIIAWFWPR
jgi:drug/metabolite transporter superfamily protein YnfA